MGLDILGYGASKSAALVAADVAKADGVGVMTLQRWQALASQLEEAGLIGAGSVDPATAFDTRYLPP
jgi:NitT/TauT family transport system substrate-binding protein